MGVAADVAFEAGLEGGLNDVIADLIALSADTRSDPGPELTGPPPSLPDQSRHRARQDAGDGAAPAAVDHRHHLLARLVDDHREAIGGGDQERPGLLGDQPVGVGHAVAGAAVLAEVYHRNRGTVYLLGGDQQPGVESHLLPQDAQVLLALGGLQRGPGEVAGGQSRETVSQPCLVQDPAAQDRGVGGKRAHLPGLSSCCGGTLILQLSRPEHRATAWVMGH